METEPSASGASPFTASPEWSEDEAAIVIRPSWQVMLAQLAGEAPEPVRVSDFGRGSRIISRSLAGEQEEHDLESEDEAEASPRGPAH
jgi:hypothetical protein